MNALSARGLIFPALVTAVAFAILLGLGFWQLERRAWKAELIARVEARATMPAVDIPAEADWPKVSAERDEYRRVAAEGTFHHDKEVHVFTSLADAKGRYAGPGYWVVTPLQLHSGAFVLVNRGFVPEARRNPATRQEGQITGPLAVTGLLRLPESGNWFTPADEPGRRLFFRRDPAAIARALELDRAAPFTIDADAADVPGGLPQGGETRLNFPDNHLQYAITWFGLAAALTGVFAAFAWQKIRGTR